MVERSNKKQHNLISYIKAFLDLLKTNVANIYYFLIYRNIN